MLPKDFRLNFKKKKKKHKTSEIVVSDPRQQLTNTGHLKVGSGLYFIFLNYSKMTFTSSTTHGALRKFPIN